MVHSSIPIMNDDALDASTGRQPGRGLDELLHVVYLSRAAAGTDPENGCPNWSAMPGPATMRRRFVACSPTAAAGSCNGWKGPAAAVVETMGRIAVDKRHRDVQVIYEASGPQQLNSPWSLIRVARVDDAETLDARVRSLATALPGDSVEPQDFVRAFTMPYGRQGLDDIASQRPVVVTGANMIWASAVVSQAAHVSRVELARTRLQSPDLRDTDGLVEYLTTTDGLTVIAIASSTMPGGYLEGIYHRAKLIVFLIRSSDINHKIELLRGLMTIHTVAEHRPTFLFAFSTAAASHKHEFLQVADSLRVPTPKSRYRWPIRPCSGEPFRNASPQRCCRCTPTVCVIVALRRIPGRALDQGRPPARRPRHPSAVRPAGPQRQRPSRRRHRQRQQRRARLRHQQPVLCPSQ